MDDAPCTSDGDMGMSFLLAIDPGDKNTGIVRIQEDNGLLVDRDTLDADEILNFLHSFDLVISRVVVERFQLYPGVAQKKGWSGVEAVEVIGMAKLMARTKGVPCKLVGPPDVNAFWKKRIISPSIKLDLRPPHEVSAYRIGEYVRTMYPL